MMILNIQKILDSQDKTKYWLSKQTGIDNTSIGKICNGETKNIRLETMEKICKALNCTPNDLIETDDPQLKRLIAYKRAFSKLEDDTE